VFRRVRFHLANSRERRIFAPIGENGDMNICSINREFYGTTEIDFNSARTILDFDAAFIDARGLIQPRDLPPAAIDFRRNEFSEFLALGRTIVVFVVAFQPEVFFPVPAVQLVPRSGKNVDFKGPDYLKEFWDAVQQDMQYHAYFVPVRAQSLPSSPLSGFPPLPGRPFLFVHETDSPSLPDRGRQGQSSPGAR